MISIPTLKADKIGIIASSLCMIHCLATPFLFLATSSASFCCEFSPTWWSALDVIFLFISFFAVYQSGKNTSKSWMKNAMWITWILLFTIVFNEKVHLFHLFEQAIYFPAVLLVILHIYNLKYCQCKTDTCCTN